MYHRDNLRKTAVKHNSQYFKEAYERQRNNPAGIRRCFDVDMRLKQHRDVDNEISTLFQRCAQDVASTL